MPFATVRIMPGVKVEQTPTLLTANIVASQNIRWRGGLPEKIGGWSAFYATPINGIARALWAWGDSDGTSHLAVGSGNNIALSATGNLTVITGGVATDISPYGLISAAAGITITTTMSSNVVTITDTNTNEINLQASVWFPEPIEIGGIILSGVYQVATVVTTDEYTIVASANATSGTSTYAIPLYTTTSGSNVVEVTFPNHGLSVGGSWAVVQQVTLGNVQLLGFYSVISVIDSSHFTIIATIATSSVGPSGLPLELFYFGQPVNTGGGNTKFNPPENWTLGNFGDLLISSPQNGLPFPNPLFYWNPIGNFLYSQLISNAPVSVTGFFIAMPQEMIVAFGASVFGVQDPMLVAWCDAGNYNVWTASASNQAGSYRLTRGSAIIGALQGPQQALLWTDVGCWVMAYIGYPDVWGFYEIGQGCGLIGQFAAAVVGSVVYWMGRRGFWQYANGAIIPLACEVWDTIFPIGVDLSQAYVIRAAGNTPFNEVTWYFPSRAGIGENDSYVRFNVLTGEWDYGLLGVSAWIDDNIFGTAISAMINVDGTDCTIMEMETTNNANGSAISWSYTTGFFMLTEGEDKVFVDQVIPDFKWKRFSEADSVSETINFTLYAQDYPDAAAGEGIWTYGPYAVTSATGAIEVRVRGRYFSAQISGSDLSHWSRLGGVKFRFSPDGRN